MKLRLFYLFLPLLFTGCALAPEPQSPENSSWEAQQTQLSALSEWSLSGKLAIITPEKRNSVNIHWQQSEQDFHIQLSTFLGGSVLDIEKTQASTVIIDSDDNYYESDNAESLITELLGMSLPIDSLQQWIKGNPNGASYQLNEHQQASSLLGGDNNNGIWSIQYSHYKPINNIYLPHKLSLERGDLRLKFAISKWQVPPQSN